MSHRSHEDGRIRGNRNSSCRTEDFHVSEVERPDLSTSSRLLDVAELTVGTRGPDMVSIRAIADQANSSVMSIYNHFGGKNGLIDSVVDRIVDDLQWALSAADAGSENRSGIDCYRDLEANYRCVALRAPKLYPMVARREIARGRPRSAAMQWIRLAEFLSRKGEAGAGNVSMLASSLRATCHGSVLAELALRRAGASALAASRAARATDLIFRGAVTTRASSRSSPSAGSASKQSTNEFSGLGRDNKEGILRK